jgi:hypothetical protein
MTIEFQKGDKVYSDTFGEGEVVEFKNGDVMRVRFFGALRDEEFTKYGQFRNGLPVSLKLVERTKPEWVPKTGELVLVRDNEYSRWVPRKYRHYENHDSCPHKTIGGERWNQCKPHPTHLNWVPWKEGDSIPEGRALIKYKNGTITWWGYGMVSRGIVAYCLLDEQP